MNRTYISRNSEMTCTWLAGGVVRRPWCPDRWAEFDSTARGQVPGTEPMGRVRLDSAGKKTSTWIDGPSSIRELRDGYLWSVGGAEFDLTIRTCGWLWGRVRFVTPGSIEDSLRVEFDLSTRGALMVDHVSNLICHTEVCRWWSWVEFGWQHRKHSWWNLFRWRTVRVRFTNLNIQWQLCAIFFGFLPDLWICKLSCDKYRHFVRHSLDYFRFFGLSTFVRETLRIMDYRHLCAGLAAILWDWWLFLTIIDNCARLQWIITVIPDATWSWLFFWTSLI